MSNEKMSPLRRLATWAADHSMPPDVLLPVVDALVEARRLRAEAAAEHQELLLTGQALATAEELLAASGVRVEKLRQTLARVLLSSLRDPLPDVLHQVVDELVGDLIHQQEDDR